jgi:hypothetical protein
MQGDQIGDYDNNIGEKPLLIRKAEMELVKNWKNFQGWDNRNCWWIR